MQKWTNVEMDVAKEIVNIGLAKAADSLSFFTKEKVMLKGLNVEIKPVTEFVYPKANASNEYHVLLTEIKGDIEGACFLNFTTEDAENFWKIALPENILADESMKAEMGKAILMEADNIITAAVVTQFANLLDVNLHGYVPQYNLVDKDGVKDFIINNSKESAAYLHFTAEFASDVGNVCPDFVWMLDASFMQKVQEFIKRKAVLS